jgi:hypothetical protein
MPETTNEEVSIDLGLVTSHLDRLGLGIGGDAQEKADRLHRYFLHQKSERGMKLAFCDSCQFYSDPELEACPFCGDAEIIEPFDENGIVQTEPARMKYSKYSEDTLDEAVESIKTSVRTAQLEAYKTGKTLELIRDEQLWRFRKKDDGRPMYKNFYDFARKEIGISKAYAARLIRVCSNYKPSDFKKFGVTKLDVSLRLPEPRRTEFLTTAQEMSARGPELSKLAKEMNDSESKTEGGAVKPEIRVPVVVPLGMNKLPMWKRNTNVKKQFVGRPTSPAKSLSEDPWTKVWLAKDICLYIRVGQNSIGELEATLDIRKGKERRDAYTTVLK